MKNLNLKLTLMAVLGVLALSCERESLAPQSGAVAQEQTLSKEKQQHLINHYGLEGMETLKIDETAFDMQKLTDADYAQIKRAFEAAQAVFYFDDKKLAQLYSKALTSDEVERLGRASYDASDVGNKPNTEAVPSEKVYYSMKFWEHANYTGRVYGKQGNIWYARGKGKDILKVNNCGWFNKMASSYKFHVEPYRNNYCEIDARMGMYGDPNLKKFIGVVGGKTQYGVPSRKAVYFVNDNFKNDDRITSTGWHFGWYTHYKKHTYNDKMESFHVWAIRTL